MITAEIMSRYVHKCVHCRSTWKGTEVTHREASVFYCPKCEKPLVSFVLTDLKATAGRNQHDIHN